MLGGDFAAVGGGYCIGFIGGCGADGPRGACRVGDIQRFTVATVDSLDQVGLGFITAVGECCPATGHFQWRQVGGAECQGQVAWQILLVEAEAAYIVQGVVDADGLQQTDRHQIA
ncbi:hypothetical protein D3C80_1341140 [compost metagenome]